MTQKIFKHAQKIFVVLFITLAIFSAVVAKADEIEQGEFEPLSERFLEWQARTDNEKYNHVPIPVDLSHLSHEESEQKIFSNNKAATLPSTYDLRNYNYVNPDIKSQFPYGTCWAFAAIGSMESNWLKQGNSLRDLSEMHASWYAFRNSDKSKAFDNMNSESFYDVMDHGGNSFYVTALYSRLDGPVPESEVPYGENLQPSAPAPEDYTRILRLRDVYYLNLSSESNINGGAEQRNVIKQRIIDNGALVANYFHNDNSYNKTSNGTAYYYSTSSTRTNHAVLIVGWDDNYSKNNFSTKPSINGAWLIKNSWGSTWNKGKGDDGYFWMSYAQKLFEGSTYTVEEADPTMKAYYYDALGWCSTYRLTSSLSSSSKIYAANVFKSERSGERLTEIGFFTPDNNIKYEAYVYTNLGSSMPATPTAGTQAAKVSGTISYAGYHTVTLDSPVSLTNGEYFSVVVYFSNKNTFPVERRIVGFSDNAVIETGSFFSINGTNWDAAADRNACIKAFTVTDDTTQTAPTIITVPSDAILGAEYSQTMSAAGTKPITWSVTSRTLPDGLTLDASTGKISGTPTTKGNYTFGITATNSYGHDTKNFTMNVYEKPAIKIKSFTGYVGYNFSATLALTSGTATNWEASSMPNGLTLSTTGEISGKPTKSGTFTPTITAQTTTAGEISGVVTFTINPKPTKPKISTSSFTAGTEGQEYSATLKFSGTEPITFSASGLPDGLTINSSTGYITGKPTTAGTYTVKFSAENIATELDDSGPVTKSIKLIINGLLPVISSPETLSNGIMNEEYEAVQFTATGSTPITWTATGLPAGMSMSSAGVLSGTPTKAKSCSVTVKAKNVAGNATKKYTLVILQKPTISTTKLSNATTDKKYSAKISAKGATPITWKIDGLPDGFTITPNATGTTATISGTTSSAGTFTLGISASNDAGTTTKELALTVKGVAPKLTAKLAKGTAGQNYSGSTIYATGTKPITISYTINSTQYNSLEDLGLTFSNNPEEGTATITGTPEISVKSLPITFSAVSEFTTKAVTKKVNFTIAGTKPAFTSPSESAFVYEVNSNVEIDFEVSGTKNITLSMNKVSGFTLTQTGDYTARLSGTAPSKAKKTTLTITAANADGKATKKITLQTKLAPDITTTAINNGALNEKYKEKITATGTKKITWSVEGDLPDGMTLSTNSTGKKATLKGTPTETGEFSFTITAENDVGIDTHEYTIIIDASNLGTLPEGDYIIAAELGEITASESGMHDFEISLDENISAGEKLYYFANSQTPCEDDTIAEFYDEGGEEIISVPESHKIILSVWLNEGVKYSPVVAVKE